MEVPIEKIEEILDYINLLNKFGPDKILWTRNGQKVTIDREVTDRYRYTGLSTKNFAEMFLAGNNTLHLKYEDCYKEV